MSCGPVAAVVMIVSDVSCSSAAGDVKGLCELVSGLHGENNQRNIPEWVSPDVLILYAVGVARSGSWGSTKVFMSGGFGEPFAWVVVSRGYDHPLKISAHGKVEAFINNCDTRVARHAQGRLIYS